LTQDAAVPDSYYIQVVFVVDMGNQLNTWDNAVVASDALMLTCDGSLYMQDCSSFDLRDIGINYMDPDLT